MLLIAIPLFASSGEPESSGESVSEEPWVDMGAIINEKASAFPAYEDPKATDLGSIEVNGSTEDIEGFSLVEAGNPPTLSDESINAIQAALEPYEQRDMPASFLLMDIGTGRGIASNIDSSIYAASSFKGPFSAFVCSEYLDTGKLDFATEITCDPSSCPSGTSSNGKDSVYHLMEAAILYSSNEAYAALRSACSVDALASWLNSLGVDGSKVYEERLPFFTTRDMSKMWLGVSEYLQGDSSYAEVLADLYEKTEMSFIRTALEESEGGEVSVRNKGGWYQPDNQKYNAVVDCGIVHCDDRDYLLCVMTGARWNQENVNRAQDLISAVFSARSDLFD